VSAAAVPRSARCLESLAGTSRDASPRAGSENQDAAAPGTTHPSRQPGVLTVAAVTLANGGNNIGVYVPVCAATGIGALITYVIVFLLLVAV
jgi:cadmium resistance protein CadD (predicted permease)